MKIKLIITIAFCTNILLLIYATNIQASTYMTYIAHLEPCVNDTSGMYNSETKFAQVRRNLLSFAREVETTGQAFDLLVSRDFIITEQAYCLSHKKETKGISILQLIDRLPSAEVGIHCDEADEYTNYADAVELLLKMSITDHGIVGGTFMTPGAPASYTEFLQPQKATLSNFIWEPKIVHGLAGPNHTGDMIDTGVWRISSSSPWEHDPASSLISIGGHRHSSESAMELLGSLNQNALNTINIMIWGHTLTNPDFMISKKKVIADWQARIDEVNWATLTEIAEIWKVEYLEKFSLNLWGKW